MFKRKINPPLKPIVSAKYRNKLNADNIERILKIQIYIIFHKEDKKIKEWYINKVVSDWYSRLEADSRFSYTRLKRVVRKCIKLNDVDKHELFRIEERTFMTERALKKLDTPIPLRKSEEVVARFENAKLYQETFFEKSTISKLKEVTNGNLSITNKRFIFKNEELTWFAFSGISEYKYTKHGFKFTYKDNTYIIRIHDVRVLNNIINSIFRRKVKNIIKKRKKNL